MVTVPQLNDMDNFNNTHSHFTLDIWMNGPSTLHLSTFENALLCLVQIQAEPEEQ